MKHDELELIYRKYYRSLFLYALSLTHNKADAEDLTANTFVKAFLSFQEGNINAWLYTVLRNEFLNEYKQKKKMADTGEFSLEYLKDSRDILEEYIAQEQKRWLYEKINMLKKREREIMLLSLLSGLKDEEIAKLTGTGVENVRVIRHRVREKLIRLSREEKI